jgi:predicted CopG family antitoxin
MGTKTITITEDAYKNESMMINDLAHRKSIPTRTLN